MSLIVLGTACVWCIVLCWFDLTQRRLPNWLTVGGILAALVVRFGFLGWPSLVDGFAAAAISGGLLFIPFLMHAAGGGDVKMLAAGGAVVGWASVLPFLFLTSVFGVIVALASLVFGKVNPARLKHFTRCLVDWRYDRKSGAVALPPRSDESARVPFSIPIAAALLAVMLGQVS